jgi:hypothetical protein
MFSASEIQSKGLPIKREFELGDFKHGVFHELICPKPSKVKFKNIKKKQNMYSIKLG